MLINKLEVMKHTKNYKAKQEMEVKVCGVLTL